MKNLFDLLSSQNDILIELISSTKKEISNFHELNPTELFDIADKKEIFMKEFASLKGEIDNYINNYPQELEDNKPLINKIENNMKLFKNENKKLMMITFSMKGLYDDLNEAIEDENNIVDLEI